MNENKSFKLYAIRIIIVIAAVFFIGAAVGIFQTVALGNDPFSCMNTAVSTFINWKFAYWQLFVNCILFIPTIIWFRNAIGFGTVFNMAFVGIFADIVRPAVQKLTDGILNMPLRIILLTASVIMLCLGVALYIATDTGMAPYDALAYILEKFTGINFSYFRIATDVICVIIGFIFGMKTGIHFQIVGIGTVITAFCTGPIVRFFQNKTAVPLLHKLGYDSKIADNTKIK